MSVTYYWSFDNPRNGDYRHPIRELGKFADVHSIAPKTTLRLERNSNVTFSQLKAAAARTLDKQKGHRQLGCRPACEMRLSRVGGRDDDIYLSELCRLPLPG